MTKGGGPPDLDESRLPLRCFSVPSPHPAVWGQGIRLPWRLLFKRVGTWMAVAQVEASSLGMSYRSSLSIGTWMAWTLVCSELEWSQLLKNVCSWQLLWRPLAVWCTVAPPLTLFSKLIGPESHDSQTRSLSLCFEMSFRREHTS